ncbi:MAG: hypothetical protein WC323_03860 [Patescibacteria group bacterium]|jgi:hypothetical protein
MFSYLEKFKKLPKELQQIVSSPKATAIVNELEGKYKVELAALVIKIMVKEVLWKDLANVLTSEQNITAEQAMALIKELKEKVFFQAVKYLNVDEVESQKSTVESTMTTDGETKPAQSPADIEAGRETVETADDDRDEELRGIVDKAATAVGIQESQADDIRRLESILKTFKKGIRDDLDTIDTLKKSRESGGLGLTQERAEKVIFTVSGKKPGVSAKNNTAVPMPRKNFTSVEQIRDVEYDLSALKKRGPVKKENNIKNPLKPTAERTRKNISNQIPLNEFSEEELEEVTSDKLQVTNNKTTTNDEPVEIKKLETAEIINDKKKKDKQTGGFVISPEKLQKAEKFMADKIKKENRPAGNQEKQRLSVRMQRPIVVDNQNKPQVNDITIPKKLQGPIEELANLDLINFRRLDDDPEKAAKKIKQKISLLEEESYTKRQQGVGAWRQSPVYKIYIAIGNESIKQGISIKDIIKKKEGVGDEVLTPEEFNAILELNRELRV